MKPIQESIMESLSEFSNYAISQCKTGPQYNRYWKDHILYLFENEAKRRFFEVSNHGNGEAWGPDQCWIDMQNGIMRGVPLVMMCEWRSSPHIEERFCTVIVARCSLRVIVFDATFPQSPEGHSKRWAEEMIAGLKKAAEAFEFSEPDDSYLFAVWCRDEGGGAWHFDSGLNR